MSKVVLSFTIAFGLGVAATPRVAGADGPPRVQVEFRRAQDEAAPGYVERRIEGIPVTVYVHDKADFVLTADDINEVTAGEDERRKPAVLIRFAAPGREKMGALTGDWVGKRLAILVDGKVVSSPILRAKITDSAIISGELTEAEVERIARDLRGKSSRSRPPD